MTPTVAPIGGIGSFDGGIGRTDNFLEIDASFSGSGVIRAYDVTATSADYTQGIFLDEVAGDMNVWIVTTLDDVGLRTTSGSILDGNTDDASVANVIGRSIDLDANGGSIGTLATPFEIDSRYDLSQNDNLTLNIDDVALEAEDGIVVTEVLDEMRLVLAHSYLGDILLTVRESALATSTGEDLQLIQDGNAHFAEADNTVTPGLHDDAPRALPHGLILAEGGSVELRVGDDIATHENSAIVAGSYINIYGDDVNNDAGYGTEILLRGQIIAGAVMVTLGNRAPSTPSSTSRNTPIETWRPDDTGGVPAGDDDRITRIFGNGDVDLIQFGDAGGSGGTTGWGADGYIYLGSKTRAYGDAPADPTWDALVDGEPTFGDPDDGEDRFVVYYLQDAAAQTSPAISTIAFATDPYDSADPTNANDGQIFDLAVTAEHTLTLDGVSQSDDYKVYTSGSNGADERNYVINVLDTGHSNDGVDELTIFGRDSDDNGSPFSTDDIFLMRSAAFLPNETADRPGYVAILHGNLSEYQDVVQNNENSDEVQRINYDTALNGRVIVEGRGGNDAFFSDDTTVIMSLDGGAGDDRFQIGQIFGAKRNIPDGNLLAQDVFTDLVATTRGWLSPGSSAPLVAQGGTGNDEFRVYSNQSELRLEGDDDNDLFIVRAFGLAAVADFDYDNSGVIDKADLQAGVEILKGLDAGTITFADLPNGTALEAALPKDGLGDPIFDTNQDGGINFLDLTLSQDDVTDDVIVLDEDGVASPQIGLGFSVAQAPDIRAGGGQDEVRYNINAPVSLEGGTGFDKVVILGTEFADDIVITKDGIFGAGVNVRYATVEVVEVDGLEGDDEFFVQSTAFGVSYRVIGGLGSDTINVTGDVTEDIVTRELEGVSGAVDHLVTSDDPLYNGLVVDGFDYNVSTELEEGLVVINEEAAGDTSQGRTVVREESVQADQFADFYTMRLAEPLTGSQVVYVTVSAARSPQEERTIDPTTGLPYDLNPDPLVDDIGDTVWLSTDPMSGVFTNTYAGLETTADDSFLRDVEIDGVDVWLPDRALVLEFDAANWDQEQTVYVFAPDDPRSEGNRVVVVQHSVISEVEKYDAVDVRNVEVDVLDNDTPGVLITEVDAAGNDDGQTIVIEGDPVTRLNDEIRLELASPPAVGNVVVDIVLNDFADQAIKFTNPSSDGRLMIFNNPVYDAINDRVVVGQVALDSSNWYQAISVGIEARDDFVREDVQIAVVEFERNDAMTTDDDYIFPNLRSGLQLLDVEVHDNESAGAVVLESGGSTQLIRDIPAGSGKTDFYDLRLTREPSDNVNVAVLTDGLADVISIDGNPVTPEIYMEVGGLQASQLFNGRVIFGDDGTNLTLTRGTGSDFGSFIDEGFTEDQMIRIDGSAGNDGDFVIDSVSLDGQTITFAATTATPWTATGESADPVVLSDLADRFIFEGDVSFGEETDPNSFPGQFIDRGLSGDQEGWLSEGFLEGMWVRIIDKSTDGNPAIEAKIQLIRGDNDSKDSKLQLINVTIDDVETTLDATWLNDVSTPDSVEVVRIAPTANFTSGDYFNLQRVELQADEDYKVPPTREGVKVFPVSTHLLSKLRGPLAVEGGPTGADRSLTNGVKLPGETDDFLIGIGAQPPESQQIDVLNIFNDSSQSDGNGTMTETTLRGFGMAEDLNFGDVTGPIFGEGSGSGELIVPGGISFGKVNLGSSAFGTNDIQSSIEVFNLMLGEGNDFLDVSGTLNPAPFVSAENAFVSTPDAGNGGGTISLAGFDWKAQGFLPGQEILIEGETDTWVVVEVLDAIEMVSDGMGGMIPIQDPNDNSILVLSGATPVPVLDGMTDVLITAIDALVIESLAFTAVTNTVGTIATRSDGADWEDSGFLEGHLVSVGGFDDAAQYRVLEIDEDMMTLLGEPVLEDGTELFWVQGPHGGLTVLHGGGNLFVETIGNYDATTVDSDNIITRLDGRSWQADGYEIGQIIQVGNEGETREILGFADAALPTPVGEFATWGIDSAMIVSGDPFAGGTISGIDLHLSVPERVETTVVATLFGDRLIREEGSWIGEGFLTEQVIFIEGFAGGFRVDSVGEKELILQGAALHNCAIGQEIEITVFRIDVEKDTGSAVGGDHFIVRNNENGALVAGPDSPLVVYGDTSQDGAWYSGRPSDRLGQEYGEKPFDPFPELADEENEDNEWVFPLANPYNFAGNDIIDASGLFAGVDDAQLPSVGFSAYGGAGNDLIIGSQSGDHLAGGSGDDTILGQRGVDHIYGDSGVNVNILTRALDIATIDTNPAPTIDPNLGASDQTFAPVRIPFPVSDNLIAGRDVLEGDGREIDPMTEKPIIDSDKTDVENVIFGDHGEVVQNVADPNLPPILLQKIQTTALNTILEINVVELQNGADDVIFGTFSEDILIGGAGNDMIDGREGDDLIFGDSVYLTRMNNEAGIADDGNLLDDILNARFQTLSGTLLYDTGRNGTTALLTDGEPRDYRDPSGPQWWAEYEIDYAEFHTRELDEGNVGVGSFGNDYIAGGADHDQIFGQLGNDVIQGDGSIDDAFNSIAHVGASRTPGVGVSIVPSFEAATDGEDYIEGGGGCDVIFGNLGQDDLIGGSSALFSLVDPNNRPDDIDFIFGGAGTQLDRNDADLPVDTSEASRHARDADVIAGDNSNIIRIVGINGTDGMIANPAKPYERFNYDNYPTPQRIVVRGVQLLDYSPQGDDSYVANDPNSPASATTVTDDPLRNTNIGGADFLLGETGDDIIHGQTKADTIYGNADDDQLHGNSGADWLSGGTGVDGLMGDDGLLLASRHGHAEPLHDMVATTQITINPDVTTTADAYITVNVTGWMTYTADLEPFFIGNHDIMYGGLDNDFMHGGAGDDAMSGAEALPLYYDDNHDPLDVLAGLSDHYTIGNVLGYDPATTLFRYYDPSQPFRKIVLGDDVPPPPPPPASAVMHFSLNSSGSVGGLNVANEDIIAFDGSDFSMLFDGSDVGVGGLKLDAFAVLSDEEILMSFTAAATVGGVAADDSDVLLFTATSLGDTTSGSFEMYFDGSDVGLTTNGEDIDAVHLLDDGRLLISTTGSPSVTGVSGKDEDLLAFTPTSLGTDTAGTWEMYFDGSDVGLSNGGGEDTDAVGLDEDGNIYLSANGDFGVAGVSGKDEDVFVFTPSSLGSTTAGTYNSVLFFDGSAFGLGGNDIRVIDIPAAGPSPPVEEPPPPIEGEQVDFLLNFESQQTFDATTPAPVIDDGRDALFGDVGNDWLVGGTNQDHHYGGYGDDLLQADDNLESTKNTTTVTYDSLIALTYSFSSQSGIADGLASLLEDARIEENNGDTTAKLGKLQSYTDIVLQEVTNSGSFTTDEAATLTRMAAALWPKDEFANDIPDPRGTGPTYADVSFGGAGRDVLIANTIEDRLYDWKSKYNEYWFPWDTNNVPGLSDADNPKIERFLYNLALSDGADPTRSGNVTRHGEPYGEIGLTRTGDADWLTQQGDERDPELVRFGEYDRGSLTFAEYEPSAEMVRVKDLGLGTSTTTSEDLLNHILMRGQLTLEEETDLTSAEQASRNELINRGFIARVDGVLQPTAALYLEIGLADAPVITTTDFETNDPTVTIEGTGDSGDTLRLYRNNGSVFIGATTVATNGTWQIAATLPSGTHRLTATQSVNLPPWVGLTSPHSVHVEVKKVGSATHSDAEAPDEVFVTAPNGEENWAPGTVQNVTWTAADNVGVTAVDLYYSASGAAGPFNTIAVNEANDGVFSWTVPDDATNNAFVRVVAHDAAGNTAENLSDGAFLIAGPLPETTPPAVAVTTPNSGENWTAGSVRNITWTATDNVGVTAVDLYYSNSGAAGPFNAIALGEANDGVFSWTVPNDPTTDAFVRVVAHDAAGNTGEDISDSAFIISGPPPDNTAPAVTVTAPNSAESWAAGSVQNITWTATDNVGVTAVNLYYSNSGAAGPFDSIALGEVNDGVFSWTVPNDATNNAYVRVVAHDAAGNMGEDVTDQAFTISQPAQTTTLKATDGWDDKNGKTLVDDGKLYLVQNSDNDWSDVEAGYYKSFQFETAVPADATIQSVIIHAEHWAENDISTADPIVWQVGGGNLVNPSILAAMNPPLYIGENSEATTSWDVTAWIDTPAKLNDLKVVVRNNDTVGKKVFIDRIYAEVAYVENLMAASTAQEAVGSDAILTKDALAPIVDEAVNRLAEAYALDQSHLALLDAVNYEIVDFNGLILGQAGGNTVWLDLDAAGHGWFIDPTPEDDSEFKRVEENGDRVAGKKSAAYGDMDLLTVVMHELGHVLGHEHAESDSGDLMEATLDTGTRRGVDDLDDLDLTIDADRGTGPRVVMKSPEEYSDNESIAAVKNQKRNVWLSDFLSGGTLRDNNPFEPLQNDIMIVLQDDEEDV